MRGPLDRITSIKTKLGVVIVAAVAADRRARDRGRPHGSAPVALRCRRRVRVAGDGPVPGARHDRPAAGDGRRRRRHGRGPATTGVSTRRRATRWASWRGPSTGWPTSSAEVDRERRELIANVSHELRTPISALQAVLENIVDGVEPADPETLRTMLAQVERLGRLVAQLLDLSRLDAGATPLETRPFAVAPLLEGAVREAQTASGLGRPRRAERRARRLQATATPSASARWWPTCSTTRSATPRRAGTVGRGRAATAPAWSSSRSPTKARASPTRSRPGVRALLPRRQRRTRRTAAPGSGLAIARWIVELHGGTIRAERREPNGCRMIVALPPEPR